MTPRGYAIRLAVFTWTCTTGAIATSLTVIEVFTGEHPLAALFMGVYVTVFAVPFTTCLALLTGCAGWIWSHRTIRLRHRLVGG